MQAAREHTLSMTRTSSRTRPVIGVAGAERGGYMLWLLSAIAVWRAGGRPRRVTPSRPCSVDELDGLILGGGADVDPRLYAGRDDDSLTKTTVMDREEGARRRSLGRVLFSWIFYPLLVCARVLLSRGARLKGLDKRRDALELALLRDALARELPVLGICRGAQLINVFLGGTLHSDLSSFYVEQPKLRTILPKKKVRVTAGSRLAAAIGQAPARVNALHDQAVRQPGENVEIVARDEAGVVQAIESATHSFAVGVQWHPELLPQDDRQQELVRELVRRAGARVGPARIDVPVQRARMAMPAALLLLASTVLSLGAGCGAEVKRELADVREELHDVRRERQETRQELADVRAEVSQASRAASKELGEDLDALEDKVQTEGEYLAAAVRQAASLVHVDVDNVEVELDIGARADQERLALSPDEHIRCRGVDTDHAVCELSVSLLQRLEASPQQLLRQGRVAPVSDRRGVGLEVVRVTDSPSSVLKPLGVREGDVLTEVNGVAVNSLGDLLAVDRDEVSREGRVTLTFRRGARARELTLVAVEEARA